MVAEPLPWDAKSRHLLTLTPPPSPPASPTRTAAALVVGRPMPPESSAPALAAACASGRPTGGVATLEQFGFVACKPGNARAAGAHRRAEARKAGGGAARGLALRRSGGGGGDSCEHAHAERYCVCQTAYDARKTYIG
jgi:hypothetical protein